jgi:hypothetical protein
MAAKQIPNFKSWCILLILKEHNKKSKLYLMHYLILVFICSVLLNNPNEKILNS